MNTIGYAVCATPRGIEILSNGLFKQLNLDNKLYLDVSNVELTSGQQVVFLERFPSSLNSNNNLDGILIGLYNFALPMVDDRRGSFIGSAIAFSNLQVNTSKLRDGLFSLFSQINKITDQESRIKFRNPGEWNINLPDSNKEYGIQNNEKLNFKPFTTQSSINVVQVSDLQRELPILLNHFMLNNAFHHVKKLYITSDSNLTKRIEENGIRQLLFNSIFNYDKHNNRLKDVLIKINQDILKSKEELNHLKNEVLKRDREYQDLNKKIEQYQKERKRLENDVEQFKKERTTLANQSSNHSHINEINNLKRQVCQIKDESLKIIRALDYDDDRYGSRSELLKKYYADYEKIASKTKLLKNAFITMAILLSSIVIFGLGYLAIKSIKKTLDRTTSTTGQIEDKGNEIKQNDNVDPYNDIISDLKNIEATAQISNDDLKLHNENIKKAIDKIKSENLNESNALYQYVIKRDWQFWELITDENNLANDMKDLINSYLKVKFGITEFYFDDLLNVFNTTDSSNETEKRQFLEKRLNNYFFINIPLDQYKYLGDDKKLSRKNWKKLDEIFDPYINDSNDIYKRVPEYFKGNQSILLEHFKFIVQNEKLNENINLINDIDQIFLPFLK